MRQERILLRFGVAVYLVDEENRLGTVCAESVCSFLGFVSQVLHPGVDGGELRPVRTCDVRDELREGGLATARWTP